MKENITTKRRLRSFSMVTPRKLVLLELERVVLLPILPRSILGPQKDQQHMKHNSSISMHHPSIPLMENIMILKCTLSTILRKERRMVLLQQLLVSCSVWINTLLNQMTRERKSLRSSLHLYNGKILEDHPLNMYLLFPMRFHMVI